MIIVFMATAMLVAFGGGFATCLALVAAEDRERERREIDRMARRDRMTLR